MFNSLKVTWQKIKDWSGWSAAGTIVLARLETLTGAITLMFAAIDWSPLFALFGETTDFSWKQVSGIGGAMLFKGIITEVTRRRNAQDLG